MTLVRRSIRDRALLKRRRIIGGSVWSSIWNGIKRFISSDTGKKIIKTGISTAAEHAPGLLGKAWNWIKGKITGKKSEDQVPEEIKSLSKKVGDVAEKKLIGFIDRKLKPQEKQPEAAQPSRESDNSDDVNLGDYTGSLPEGYGMRKRGRGRGKGMAPLGAGPLPPIGTGMQPLGLGMRPLGASSAIPSSKLTTDMLRTLQNIVKKGSGIKLTR